MRSKLFLSYSRDDKKWRDRFLRHLKGIFPVGEDLWVDAVSIEAGALWEEEIRKALSESRCALALLTPSYLDCQRYARRELDMAIEQRADDLQVIPVLAEPCLWDAIASLAAHQFVRWGDDAHRDELRPLTAAGDDERAIDVAVLEICQVVGKKLGVMGQTTPQQRDRLFEQTKQLLQGRVDLETSMIHSGDFAVVYRGTSSEGEPVAVKSVPDAPRQNRIRMVFDRAVASVRKLRDPSFIRVHYAVVDREPHCLVMDYVDWPTLEATLASRPGRCLPPNIVAKVLAKIAAAQRNAHENDFSIGPLAASGIHVGDDWDVRLSPIRIESQLARAASMATGQLLNWDALTHLSPEVSGGRTPRTREEMDAHGQYYLGLLALELLLGHRPFEVRCFDDLLRRPKFFDEPRSFFESRGVTWVAESPALAFVLARMLARNPEKRLLRETTASELELIADGELPQIVRQRLDEDSEAVHCRSFTTRFYERLFALRPDLTALFKNVEDQADKLAAALQHLVEFRPELRNSQFRKLAKKHARFNIGSAETEAFRTAFLQQILEVFGGSQEHADAWGAAFHRTLGVMHVTAESGTATKRSA